MILYRNGTIPKKFMYLKLEESSMLLSSNLLPLLFYVIVILSTQLPLCVAPVY